MFGTSHHVSPEWYVFILENNPTGVLAKMSIHFQRSRISGGPFIYLSSKSQPLFPLSSQEDTFGPSRHRLLPRSHCPPSTLNRDTWECFQDYFSQGDNLLFGLCMSAKLLNFENSWIKLDVANLHLQIDFVHTGICTHISRDEAGGVRQLMGNDMTVCSACLWAWAYVTTRLSFFYGNGGGLGDLRGLF